jgi:hypothetical protein
MSVLRRIFTIGKVLLQPTAGHAYRNLSKEDEG